MLDWEDAPGEIYLKLENLQPMRAFKIRGAYNCLAALGKSDLVGRCLDRLGRQPCPGGGDRGSPLGVACTVYVPDTAPRTKVNNSIRYGARVVEIPYEERQKSSPIAATPRRVACFIHPYSDPAVIAGQATCGLEILEDLPDVDTIIAPWGGGGLCSGIAAVRRHIAPGVRVIASEIETGAPRTLARHGQAGARAQISLGSPTGSVARSSTTRCLNWPSAWGFPPSARLSTRQRRRPGS